MSADKEHLTLLNKEIGYLFIDNHKVRSPSRMWGRLAAFSYVRSVSRLLVCEVILKDLIGLQKMQVLHDTSFWLQFVCYNIMNRWGQV